MNTRRRWLAAGVAWPVLALTDALRAQAPAPLVIGWLSPTSRTEAQSTRAFNEGMAALGWKVGTQYVLEERHAEAQVDRLPALAQEIAAKKPAAIVVLTSIAARAAAAAAPATPIVMAAGDPLSTGLVTNLARPGGMITGLSNVTADLNAKLVEMLVESLPKLKRVGFLLDSTSLRNDSVIKSARRTATQLRVQALIADVARPEDIEPALARLAKDKAQALVLFASQWIGPYHPKILEFALTQRWPVVGSAASITRGSGLLSYGANRQVMVRRSATYVDRILKGAKPADLPIEQPTTFDLVLNLKTAKSLGITMPQSMLIRATEVIE